MIGDRKPRGQGLEGKGEKGRREEQQVIFEDGVVWTFGSCLLDKKKEKGYDRDIFSCLSTKREGESRYYTLDKLKQKLGTMEHDDDEEKT